MAELSKFWNLNGVGDANLGPYSEQVDVAGVLNEISLCASKTTNGGGVFNGDLSNLAVSSTTSPISVATGRALVNGTFYENNTSAISVIIPTPVTSTRIDRMVLRKDFVGQTVRLTRIIGVEGGAEPALVQTTAFWDIPLAKVSIVTGGTITLTDEREFVPGTSGSPLAANQINTWSALQTMTGELVLGTPAHGVVVAEGASACAILGVGTSGQFLQTQGTSADPVWTSVLYTPGTVVSATATALPSVGSAPVGQLTISGTTTITSFTSVPAAGTLLAIAFSGALKVTNGSNIVLRGALDFYTAAGSILWAYSDGTNINEISRSWTTAGDLSNILGADSGNLGTNTWTDSGVSLSVTPGYWDIQCQATVGDTAGTSQIGGVRLYDATNTLVKSVASTMHSANSGDTGFAINAKLLVTATITLKLQGITTSGSGIFKAASTSNGAGNFNTQMLGFRYA